MNPATLRDLLWYTRGLVKSNLSEETFSLTKTASNMALFVDPAQLKKKFSKSLLELSAKNFRQHTTSNDQLKLRFLGNIVGLISSGSDPHFALPAFSIEKDKPLLLEAELLAREHTVFTVYYKTTEIPHYCEEQTQSYPLSPGRNVFHMIFNVNLEGALRIDPANVKTVLAVKNMVLSVGAD
jgi:hypothetical protein